MSANFLIFSCKHYHGFITNSFIPQLHQLGFSYFEFKIRLIRLGFFFKNKNSSIRTDRSQEL